MNYLDFQLLLYVPQERYEACRAFYEQVFAVQPFYGWDEGPEDRGVKYDLAGAKLVLLTQEDPFPTYGAVHFQLEGAKMLDLFCGSGQMGIEALSRGAEVCVFVDKDRRSIEVTKQNLVSAGLFQKARVTQTDFQSYLTGCKDSFDIAFLDPPYSCGILQQALPLLDEMLAVQSAEVDTVSGATLTAEGLIGAVENALGKAAG